MADGSEGKEEAQVELTMKLLVIPMGGQLTMEVNGEKFEVGTFTGGGFHWSLPYEKAAAVRRLFDDLADCLRYYLKAPQNEQVQP